MTCRVRLAVLTAILAALVLAPVATAVAPHNVNATASLKRTLKPAPNKARQSGPIKGSPFGSGTMTLNSTLKQGTVTSKFTVRTSKGLVNGRAKARLTVDGDTARYKGTATITSGTRKYRRITGGGIKFTGKGPVNAKRVDIRLAGRVKY